MSNSAKPWDVDEAVAYYRTQRREIGHLYESERVFFRPVMERSDSVLDVGCACGGMSRIILSVNQSARYVGVDVSERMIEAATMLFPQTNFRLTSHGALDFPDASFDTVLALGVLNHVPDYQWLLREMYRVASKYVLVDLPRLVPHAHVFDPDASYMVLEDRFGTGDVGDVSGSVVSYVVADAAEVFGMLGAELRPSRILAKGYFGRYNESVVCPFPELCFAVACLIKEGPDQSELILDLPLTIRERLRLSGLSFAEPFQWILS